MVSCASGRQSMISVYGQRKSGFKAWCQPGCWHTVANCQCRKECHHKALTHLPLHSQQHAMQSTNAGKRSHLNKIPLECYAAASVFCTQSGNNC